LLSTVCGLVAAIFMLRDRETYRETDRHRLGFFTVMSVLKLLDSFIK